MKFLSSPLELLDFNILKSTLSFESPTNVENVIVNEFVSKYEIDIDFAIRNAEDGVFAIFTKITINEGENKVPGHSIFVEGVSVFRINNYNQLNKEESQNLLLYSGVSIAFSNLRGYIADITAYTVTGSYLVPALDMQATISTKQKLMQAKKKESIPQTVAKGKTKSSKSKK